MRYELTDLRLFLEIAHAKSLTAAAATLFITTSAASYRLKNLEQALGTPLFERNSRGMELTQAGEAVLAHVREIFEGVERMQGDVSRFISGIKGHVRIIANSSSLSSFVTQTLGRFLVAHPGIDADVEERQSETIPAAVLAREADIGIFAGTTDVQGLAIHPYAVDRLVIVAPPAHEISTCPSVRLSEALNFDFVCMHRTSSNFLFLRDAAAKQGRTVTARLHAQGFEAVLSLVAAGVGIAMLPSSVLENRQEPHRVVRLELDEPWARRELSLAVRADARFPDFITACMDFLLDDALVAATRTFNDLQSRP